MTTDFSKATPPIEQIEWRKIEDAPERLMPGSAPLLVRSSLGVLWVWTDAACWTRQTWIDMGGIHFAAVNAYGAGQGDAVAHAWAFEWLAADGEWCESIRIGREQPNAPDMRNARPLYAHPPAASARIAELLTGQGFESALTTDISAYIGPMETGAVIKTVLRHIRAALAGGRA